MDIFYEEQLSSTATTYTVQTFYNKFSSTPVEIDLSPTFQREFVWSLNQQAFLVDSILRGLPVPEVYVQETTSADGQQRSIVVDGQQRITSCMRYIENDFAVPNTELFNTAWRGKYFSDLADSEKKRFRGFTFVVRLLPDRISTDELRQIFKRLNQTVVALNRSELRNAEYNNEFTSVIKKAAQAKPIGDLGVFSANDYRRKLDEEFISEVLLAIYSGVFPNKKQGLEEMFRDLDAKPEKELSAILADISQRLGRSLAYVAPIASDLKRTRFRNKSDFYSLLVFLLRNADRLSPNSQNSIKEAITVLSERVNHLRLSRTTPLADEAHQIDDLASQYLEAVQRAASDRLNRVIRDEVLNELLEPLLDRDGTSLNATDDLRLCNDESEQLWQEDLDDAFEQE